MPGQFEVAPEKHGGRISPGTRDRVACCAVWKNS